MNSVRNYFIGRCKDMQMVLKWAEDKQHTRITLEQLDYPEPAVSMMDVDLKDVSAQMWSWLHLNLNQNDQMMLTFEMVEPLNGVEIWPSLS